MGFRKNTGFFWWKGWEDEEIGLLFFWADGEYYIAMVLLLLGSGRRTGISRWASMR